MQEYFAFGFIKYTANQGDIMKFSLNQTTKITFANGQNAQSRPISHTEQTVWYAPWKYSKCSHEKQMCKLLSHNHKHKHRNAHQNVLFACALLCQWLPECKMHTNYTNGTCVLLICCITKKVKIKKKHHKATAHILIWSFGIKISYFAHGRYLLFVQMQSMQMNTRLDWCMNWRKRRRRADSSQYCIASFLVKMHFSLQFHWVKWRKNGSLIMLCWEVTAGAPNDNRKVFPFKKILQFNTRAW